SLVPRHFLIIITINAALQAKPPPMSKHSTEIHSAGRDPSLSKGVLMVEGLWTVEFRSSTGNTGYGTVVFDGKKAMGGTAGYYYFGDYQVEGDTLNASLRV